jgi:hypothetical protein
MVTNISDHTPEYNMAEQKPVYTVRHYEVIFAKYAGAVMQHMDKPVVEIATMTAEAMGVSVQMVQEACALVLAARIMRQQV